MLKKQFHRSVVSGTIMMVCMKVIYGTKIAFIPLASFRHVYAGCIYRYPVKRQDFPN